MTIDGNERVDVFARTTPSRSQTDPARPIGAIPGTTTKRGRRGHPAPAKSATQAPPDRTWRLRAGAKEIARCFAQGLSAPACDRSTKSVAP